MARMSAGTVGRHMPSVITLDDLAEMIAADTYGHRYETSPEGVLSVMPPPDSEHAAVGRRSRCCRRRAFALVGRVAMEAGYLT
jgi:hypothetical protein